MTSPNDDDDDDSLDGCIWLTEKQIDAMTARLNNDTKSHHRQKRTFINFATAWDSDKWSMPVTYKFDGAHSQYTPLGPVFTQQINLPLI